jgi:hypothetical protein
MKKLSLVAMAALAILAGSASAQTTAVLRGGICINEILIDPNSTINNFDTDGNGAANDPDEFWEIYNVGSSPINIGGLQIIDPGSGGVVFTFPSVVLNPGNYAVVVAGVQSGGSLPPVGPGNFAYDALFTFGPMTNGGDNVILYDPTATPFPEYTQLLYNGDPADDVPALPTVADNAVRVGPIENWGSDIDGTSLSRFPSGSTSIFVHNSIPGSVGLASPGANATPPEDPSLAVSGTLFFFPTQLSSTSTKTLRITNAGTSAVLNVTGLAVQPPGPTNFTVLTPLPLAIPAGNTGDIQIRFNAPGAAGDYNETYRITSNDPSDPTFDITLDAEATDFVPVPDVATARSLSGGDDFRITGEVALSIGADRFGSFIGGGGVNRTFPIQDSSAGMIAIEIENDLVLAAGEPGGTRITGLRGRKTFFQSGFGSFIEQVRIYGYDTISAGAPLTPAVTTAVILRDTPNDVEAELIQINGVTLGSDPNGTGLWDDFTNYTFAAGSELFTVRLQSSRTALHNTPLPPLNTPTDLIGIGYEFGGSGQLSPVSVNDLGTAPTSVEAGWNMYQ